MTNTKNTVIKDPDLVVYDPEEGVLLAHIMNGKTLFDKIDCDVFMAQHPHSVLMTYAESLDALENQYLSKPWTEIDEKTFMKNFEILPPRRWQCTGDFEFFFNSEPLHSLIYNCFCRFKNRYFTNSRKISQPYDEMVDEITKQFFNK